MIARGAYLALEGVEGAGKTTVADKLVVELEERGHQVVRVREPGGTELGEEIRRLLLHSGEVTPWAEAALFAAQRAQLASQVLRPALAAGRWVVSDRTYFSSLAYQGAGRELGVEEVRQLNELVLEGVTPDLVVVLEVDPQVGLRRQQQGDRIGDAGLQFQQVVAAAYRRLAEADPARVVLVSADSGPDEAVKQIVELAKERLGA